MTDNEPTRRCCAHPAGEHRFIANTEQRVRLSDGSESGWIPLGGIRECPSCDCATSWSANTPTRIATRRASGSHFATGDALASAGFAVVVTERRTEIGDTE